ncbi:MAG: DUF4124 domain-containing protein [Proteobacteria bacterium]|nr:DUF4124 domain-containing protein [Pseudomonadota bacterium]
MPRKFLFVLLACAAPAVLAQAIYSWKDASGQVHYSDSPPPDAQVRTVKQAPLAPRPAASEASAGVPPQSIAEKELAFKKRRAAAEEAEEKARNQKQADEQLQQDCTRFRQQLAGLEAGQPVMRPNDAGEQVYIGDDERASDIARIRQYLERSCK